MDTQIWDKLLLLIAGGVLTALGAWFNDLRGEKRRKNAKLEEAYLAWLNTQSSVLGRLKELTKLAEHEPESMQAHGLLLDKFELLYSELRNLSSALNLAFIYERDRKKKALVEVQAVLYGKLAERLNVIISHHKTHLDFHVTIGEANSLVDAANDLVTSSEDLMKANTDSSKVDLTTKLTELKQRAERHRQRAQQNRDSASDHLTTCAANLSMDTKELYKEVEKIEGQAPALRRALVE